MVQLPSDIRYQYARTQQAIRKKANRLMAKWAREHGLENRTELTAVASSIVNKYGPVSGETACRFYSTIAQMEGVNIPDPSIAEPMDVEDVGFTLNGALKDSKTAEQAGAIVERLVKQVAEDTILKNAIRDSAVWAWVPTGLGTCPFCIVLASNGWQKASKKQIMGGHASHIHPNCNCEFIVSFKGGMDIDGYNPQEYLDMYNNAAPGQSSSAKIKALRRILEAKDKTAKAKDVTSEVLKNARPGYGIVKKQKGTSRDDSEMAEWLQKTIGGNIVCLEETPEDGKMPDALWNNEYWEFKRPTTNNAIDDRIRKANKQLTEAKARNNNIVGQGIVIDISGYQGDKDLAIIQIEKVAGQRIHEETTIVIKHGDEMLKAIKTQKK